MKTAKARSKLRDMLYLRSRGKTINDTAGRLGLYPWEVAYLTKAIKCHVTLEEALYIEEQAERIGFTEGELIMDVWTEFGEEYLKLKRRKSA